MTNPSYHAVQDYWLSLFPCDEPMLPDNQVNVWLETYGLDEILHAMKLAAQKHNQNWRDDQQDYPPMNPRRFMAYATAVMRNRKSQSRVLPLANLLCDKCGWGGVK